MTSRSLNRARWFSDLTAALAQAEHLLSLMEADGDYPLETTRLRLRVQAVRSELELLDRVFLTGKRVIETPWLEGTETRAGNR